MSGRRARSEGGTAITPTKEGPAREIRSALERARRVASAELAPLSGLPRGAVVLGDGGAVADGARVELPVAPRLSVCAEHAALAAAVADGISPRVVVIWAVPEDPFALPCGVCRQVLAELAPKAALWLQQGDGAPRRLDAESLLPHPFDERALPGRREQGAAEP